MPNLYGIARKIQPVTQNYLLNGWHQVMAMNAQMTYQFDSMFKDLSQAINQHQCVKDDPIIKLYSSNLRRANIVALLAFDAVNYNYPKSECKKEFIIDTSLQEVSHGTDAMSTLHMYHNCRSSLTKKCWQNWLTVEISDFTGYPM